jgi:hypothetical protein
MRMVEWAVTIEVEVRNPALLPTEAKEFKEFTSNVYATSEDEVRRMILSGGYYGQIVIIKSVRRADEPDNRSDLRKRMDEDLKKCNPMISDWRVLTVAVEMPTGDIETITNHGHNQITRKLEYYAYKYDDNMRLKANKDIRIIDFMLV